MKDGDFYDRCPHDGCLEVDYVSRNEGDGGLGKESVGNRETAHEWSIYSADRRKGGCGGLWTRTNSVGAARDRARGVEPASLTRDAQVERTYFLGSERYRSEYERIFGHA